MTALGLALGACDASDRTAGPERPLPAPALQTVGLDPFSTTLGLENAGNPTNSVPLPTYPRPTLARFSISGLTTVTWTSGDSAGQLDTTLDARGRWWGYCAEGISLWFTVSHRVPFPSCNPRLDTSHAQATMTTTALVQGQGSATWTGGKGITACNGGPCRNYEGDKTISIEPIQVNFTVTVSPTTVNYKDTVAVTAAVSDSQVDGLNLPWGIDSVKWVPAFGTQASPCAWSNFVPYTGPAATRICRKPFTRSGTMTVFATVNGAQAQGSVSVTVTPPTLDVTASPTSLADSGAVTFTAAVTPSTITWTPYWSWNADSPPGGITSYCQSTEKTCTRGIWKSGWMKVTAFIGEYTLVDSAHVSVVPCLTGDSLLDDSRNRKLLNDAMNGSNPDGSPWDRVERGGIRMLMSEGSVRDTLLPIGPTDNPCGMTFPNPATLPGAPLLYWHVHPFNPRPSDPLPYDSTQTPRSNCRQLATAEPPPPGQVYYMLPGPSTADSTSGLRPHLIVDKDNVWFMPSTSDPDQTIRHFPRHGAGVCDPLAR